VTSTLFIVTIYKLRVLFTIVDISYLPTLGLPQAPCCPARIRTSIIWTKTRCAAFTPQDSVLSNMSKTFLWEQVDSNHRTRMRRDLQSLAIAAMRYSQLLFSRLFCNYFINNSICLSLFCI
jgi:hypothetical protein